MVSVHKHNPAVGTKSSLQINMVSLYVRLVIKCQRNYTVAGWYQRTQKWRL